MAQPKDFWVIDSSSIIQIRRVVRRELCQEVLSDLTKLVDAGSLVFPRQVIEELDRFAPDELPAKDADLLLPWAKQNQNRACRFEIPLDLVKDTLATAPVLDADKASGVDEADPYVLALARHVAAVEGGRVTVLTEEQKDLPTKMSLATGCGLLYIPCLKMEPFLRSRGVWPRPKSE